MGWDDARFTQAGVDLIRRCADTGAGVRITAARAGDTLWPAASLPGAARLAGETKQELQVADVDDGDHWKRLHLQVTPVGLTEGYQLRQIGIWGRGGETETPVLMFILQDEEGFAIPSAEEMPWFSLTVSVVLEIDDPGDMVIEQECWIVPADKTVTIPKLAPSARGHLRGNLCLLDEDAVIVEDLMDKTASQIYAMFDAYVESGLLTKSLAGYASKPLAEGEEAEGDAEEDQTRPIWMYRWEHPVRRIRSGTSQSRILLTGNMHGNEKCSVPALLNLLDKIEKGNDAGVNRLCSQFDLDIIPVVNPWGVDAAVGTTIQTINECAALMDELKAEIAELKAEREAETDEDRIAALTEAIAEKQTEYNQAFIRRNLGRLNGRGVNINRNADFCWYSTQRQVGTLNYKGPSAASEAETKILAGLADSSGYAYHLDIHGCVGKMPFYVVSSGAKNRSTARTVALRMAARMRDHYHIDLDGQWRHADGSNRTVAVAAGANAHPANAFAHKRLSSEYGATVELQRFDPDSGEMHPEEIQRYTSEYFLSFLCAVSEVLTDQLSARTTTSRNVSNGRNNLLPMASNKWVNVSRGAAGNVFGFKNRASTYDPVPVSAGAGYIFGVSASDDVRINLRFVSADGTYARNYLFSGTTRRVVFPGNGHVFPILKKVSASGSDAFIDPGEIGWTIVPFLYADGGAIPQDSIEFSEAIIVDNCALRILSNVAVFYLAYHFSSDNPPAQREDGRYTVCRLPIYPQGNIQTQAAYLSSGSQIIVPHALIKEESSKKCNVFAYPGTDNHAGKYMMMSVPVPLANYEPVSGEDYDEPYVDPDEDGGEEPEV